MTVVKIFCLLMCRVMFLEKLTIQNRGGLSKTNPGNKGGKGGKGVKHMRIVPQPQPPVNETHSMCLHAFLFVISLGTTSLCSFNLLVLLYVVYILKFSSTHALGGVSGVASFITISEQLQ